MYLAQQSLRGRIRERQKQTNPLRVSTYAWTHHARAKMRFYGIAEGRVKRIVRFPTRTEISVLDEAVAAMQPAGTKRYQELWVMYRTQASQILIITVWRYPGKSPERDPVPEAIIREAQKVYQGMRG